MLLLAVIIVLLSDSANGGSRSTSAEWAWTARQVESFFHALGDAAAAETVRADGLDGKTLVRLNFQADLGLPRDVAEQVDLSLLRTKEIESVANDSAQLAIDEWFPFVQVSTHYGFEMFLIHPSQDAVISRHIAAYGVWEVCNVAS